MLPTRVRRQIFHIMLGIALCTPPVYPQGCASKSCLQCINAPANCTVDNITQTVSCTGNTSSCTITQCTGINQYCLATYYGNRTSSLYYFTSGCFYISAGFDCASNPQTCVGSGNVSSETELFSSFAYNVVKLVVCNCYADNCTSNISFHYDIVPPLVSSIRPSPSLLPNEPDAKQSLNANLYYVVTVVMCILTCIIVALVVAAVVCICVIRLRTIRKLSITNPQII